METDRLIDDTQIAVAEMHDMTTAFEFRKTNGFARQGLADEQVLPLPFDFSSRTDAPHLVAGIVRWLGQPFGPPPPGRAPMRGWRGLPQGFMRPLVVVVLPEAIEPRLLLAGRGGRRAGRHRSGPPHR